MKLSIVSTLYKSEKTCIMFTDRILKAAEKISPDIELILVDDGSPDESVQMIERDFKNDKRIVLAQLSRNFGHHHAMMAGLTLVKGDIVFLIDSDLEESPELINLFYENFLKQNCDVVYGYQEKRKGGINEKTLGFLFYKLFNFLSSIKLKRNVCVARIMSKEYVESLLKVKDKALFLAGIWELIGFRQVAIKIKKKSRKKSSYSFKKRLVQALTAISSFSTRPLFMIFLVGLITLIFGGILFLYNSYIYFSTNSSPPGFMTLFVLQIISLGLIVFNQGVIAIYLSTIFKELKPRPNFIIRKIFSP